MFYYEQFFRTALDGIDRSNIMPVTIQIAQVILLISFLVAVYESFIRGGDVRMLGIAAVKYVGLGSGPPRLCDRFPGCERDVQQFRGFHREQHHERYGHLQSLDVGPANVLQPVWLYKDFGFDHGRNRRPSRHTVHPCQLCGLPIDVRRSFASSTAFTVRFSTWSARSCCRCCRPSGLERLLASTSSI